MKKMKKADYPNSILATFDYMTDALFLSRKERKRLLNGYDPVLERLGPEPDKRSTAYLEYTYKYSNFVGNLSLANKAVVDSTIRTCMGRWMNPRPDILLKLLTKDQLFVLDLRIQHARRMLEIQDIPCKDPEKPNTYMDTFFPAVCLFYLLPPSAQ